ncbi:MAG: DUF4842 domain-containing protein [Bacteroides sp.]
MKTKMYAALCTALFIGASCIDNAKDLSTIATQRIICCETANDYQVPIRKGYTTYVTCGEDTLAVANQPITIKIPKSYSIAATRGGEGFIKVDQKVLAAGSKETYAASWQAVMFEDTPNGDYDYNDLIIHVRNNMSIPWGKEFINQFVDIQPIAMGGEKTITLGCILSNGKEHILSKDVRSDLFHNVKGFINTEDEKAAIRYKLEHTSIKEVIPHNNKEAAWIAWFIEVGGQRMYAASTDIPYQSYEMVNKENMPYGIVVYGGHDGRANGTFRYPKEYVSIFTVYPGFQDWINGTATNIGEATEGQYYIYSATGLPGLDGKLNRKIWDWQDLK